MTTPAIGRLALLAALLGASAPALAEETLPCRPNLVHCNYAEHFSGTIHLRSVLKVAANAASGIEGSESVDDVKVTVVAGKATCSGKIGGESIDGAGAFAVERGASMEDAPGQPWYEISVACPTPDGGKPSIDGAQIKTYKQKDSTGFKALAGKIEEEHVDADPANGVTGTIKIEWSISRSGGGRV